MEQKNTEINPKYVHALCVLGVVLGIFIYMWVKYPPILFSNDDITLRSIFNGDYTGKPEANGIYMMYVLGLIFKAFYSIAKGVNWYSLILVALHFVSFFVITFKVGTLFENLKARLIASAVMCLVLFSIDLNNLALYQYTQLAGLVAAAGVMSIVCYRKESRKLDLILAISLLTATLWLRKQVFLMALPVVVLAVIALFFIYSGKILHFLRKIALPAIILIGIAVTSVSVEKIAYSSDAWKSYFAFNDARTDAYDYNLLPEYADNKEFYDSIGVSTFKYTVLYEVELAFIDDGGESVMETLADEGARLQAEWAKYYSVPKSFIKGIYTTTVALDKTTIGILVALAFLIGLYIFIRKKKWPFVVILVAAYGYKALFLGYFTYKGRVPERITFGLYAMIFVLLCGMIVRALDLEGWAKKLGESSNIDGSKVSDESQKRKELSRRIFTPIAILIVIVVAEMRQVSFPELDTSYGVAKNNISNWVAVNEYASAHPDEVYLFDSYAYATISDYLWNGESLAPNLILASNWPLLSPISDGRYERLAEIETVMSGLADGSIKYISASDRRTDWVDSYCIEETGINTNLHEISRFTGSAEVEFIVYSN